MTPIEFFEALSKMPLESYFILIPIFILIVTLIFGEKLFIYLFIVIICFVFYIFKQQIDMEFKLLKEKQKNESNDIYNKIDDLTEKISLFYEEFQQQRFQEDDTLNNNSSNLSSNDSRNFSSSSRGKIISTYKYLLLRETHSKLIFLYRIRFKTYFVFRSNLPEI